MKQHGGRHFGPPATTTIRSTHARAAHAGGISVTLVGHPFDTLKVRLQTQPMDKPIYCE